MLPDSDAWAAGAPIAADGHAPAEDSVVTAATGTVTDEALAAAGATVLVTDVLAATPTPVVASAEPFAGADAVGRAATDVRMPAGTGAQSATTAPDVLQTTGPLTTSAESEQPATNTGAAPRPAAAPASATTAPASATAVAPASAAATAASESTRTAAEPGMSDAAPTAPVVAAPADARAATASAAPAPVPRHVLLPQLSAPVLSLARAADGEHSVTLTVSPESLGPVTVRAHIAAGVIRLELHAPSEAGREALRAILTDLRRDLAVAAPGSSLAMSSDSSAAGPSADGRQGAGGRSDTGAGSDARTGGDAHTGGHAREERDGLPDRRSSPSTPLIRALPPHGGLDLYA
jgi:flagellar hook-length control protein FliK